MTSDHARRESRALPLEGARVVEIGPGVAGAFAGKWLAALGAEVVKVEPPEGDPARRAGPFRAAEPDAEASGRFLYLNTAKRSVVLDVASPSDRARLDELIAQADLLIDSSQPGLDVSELRRRHPRLVVVSVTAFGRSGPYAGMPETPLTQAALSGMLWHLCEIGRPPLAQPAAQPEYLGGLHGLGAALAGYYGALTSGEGFSIDVSLQTCCAAAMGHYTSRVSQVGSDGGRLGPRALWRVYPAADGWAGICALRRNYAAVARSMQLPELAQASPFQDPRVDAEEDRRITELVGAWFARHTCREVWELALRDRVPLAYVMSIEDVAHSEQLAHRDFFARETHPRAGELIYPGQLWLSEAHGWARERAPRLGEHAARFTSARARAPAAREPAARAPSGASPRLPLDSGSRRDAPLWGVRVLDLGQIWAGPYAAMLLGDQGADVIKVESPTNWDYNRSAGLPPPGREAEWWNTCAYFHEYNHNKRGVSLDLTRPRGRELFGRLVAQSDVVIENYRADTLDKLGVGYAWLRAQRHEIVLVSMAGFGRSGPESQLLGYGPIIEQTSGFAGMTGYGDGTPQLVQYAYGDPVAAVAGAAAAIVGLLQRRITGRGQHIDLSQRDVATALLGEAFMEWSMTRRQPPVLGNGHAWMAPHNVYHCAGEDEWVAIAVADDTQWDGLCAALDRPAWSAAPELRSAAGRRQRRAEIDAHIEAWTRARDKREVFERCRAAGVPAGPVWRDSELLADPQLAHRRFHETLTHPAVGSWKTSGWVWRPEAAGLCVRRKAPGFAEHNDEILGGLLGLSADEIAKLEAEGVTSRVPLNLPPLKRAT